MFTRAILTAVVLGVCVVPSHAQTLAEASAAAKKMTHEWPLSSNLGAPPEPELTAAELADLDRSKFDKVYAAGKAVHEASYLSAVGVSPRQFQQLLLAMNTELSIAADKVTTKAEKSLFGKYQMAELSFDLGLTFYGRYNATKGTAAMREATERIDAADKIYLGKPAS
jgi:hypothetical protein